MYELPYFVAILLVIGLAAAQINYTSVVQLNSGPVRGQILTTVRKSVKYSSFEGIPFAKPPIGSLRFQPPVRIGKWQTVLNATKTASACAQPNQVIPGSNAPAVGSEDCLYVNVYTPQTSFTDTSKTNQKAVLVWIYGGGFITGSQLSSSLRPDFLLENDVVIVSANYRLGALGFLNLNLKSASGNAGLKDQSLALRWVKENIAQFGGDPDKVTIFGQSAGSVSVDLHVVSKMSAGLFQQSLAMSGSPLCPYWPMQTNKEAKQQAFALGSKLGYNSNSVEGLLRVFQSASVNDIISKQSELPGIPFRPTVEKETDVPDEQKFLDRCALNRYIDGKGLNKGRHMMGFTSNELKSFLVSINAVAQIYNLTAEKFREAAIPLDLSPQQKLISSLQGNLSSVSKKQLDQLILFTSDLAFVSGIDEKQRYLSLRNGQPIYYYRFAFEGAKYVSGPSIFSLSNPFNVSGVGHAEDLLYVFYGPAFGVPINQPQISLTIDRYTTLITNFAKYGNPTPLNKKDPQLNITWPPSGTEGLHLEINEQLSIQPRPITNETRLIQLSGAVNSPLLLDCISFDGCQKVVYSD
ncbi:hypothetical protein QAD02_019606 [Eretmocerus hayati]|uniref:Uncharacterized protein n=1 Tax=Eretmocerus hayati TaxID=131215 RepID=A0ACC2PJQ8_9HYME|nr:hypothetical protein QAD02_019606 [Eretmocerus hayati]